VALDPVCEAVEEGVWHTCGWGGRRVSVLGSTLAVLSFVSGWNSAVIEQ
jgi:hypothetical protein